MCLHMHPFLVYNSVTEDSFLLVISLNTALERIYLWHIIKSL